MDDPSWAPGDVDPHRPSVARVYDFYLGGSHNFAADREFGRQVVEAWPDLPFAVRANREFLRRVVGYLVGEGIDQFLDLGSGIPTVGNVHEVAQGIEPRSRVVYVDHDPVAVAHATALLESTPQATALFADVSTPRTVLDKAVATGLLDLGRPCAVLLFSVMQFLDADDPAGIVAEYMRATAPGSMLGLSHPRSDGDPDVLRTAVRYNATGSPSGVRLRTRDEIASLFGDLMIVEPGLVALPRWHPELTGDDPAPAELDATYPTLGAVGVRS